MYCLLQKPLSQGNNNRRKNGASAFQGFLSCLSFRNLNFKQVIWIGKTTQNVPIGEIQARFKLESDAMTAFECERLAGLTIMHCDDETEDDEIEQESTSGTFVSTTQRA